MTALYVITKIFTFPGAIIKALFEQIMCRIYGSPVEDSRYMRTNEMCGHVEHELIDGPVKSYFFCFIPGLLNFLIGLFVSLFAVVNVDILGNYSGFISNSAILNQVLPASLIANTDLVGTLDFILPLFFLWVSFSMFVNMAPLVEDVLSMKEQYSKLNPVLKVIFFPGYIGMRVGAKLEGMGLTFVIFAVIAFFMAIL